MNEGHGATPLKSNSYCIDILNDSNGVKVIKPIRR